MSTPHAWRIRGELMLSCNCTLFCPCVISLGKHPPTEGYCQTWGGMRIDDGVYGKVALSGLNLGLIMEIPGLMSRGNWSVGLYIDERADDRQLEALTRIMSGKAGGTTHLLSILVGEILGVSKAPVIYEVAEDGTRHFNIHKRVEGEIKPIPGQGGTGHTTIENSQYWIAPQITVAQAVRSRFRDFGRNWDFRGRSAEICALDWRGP